MTQEITELRKERSKLARDAQARVDRLETQLRDALAERDDLFWLIHGDKAEGYLSYQDISDATNGKIGKGRIIQIVQPRYKDPAEVKKKYGDTEATG